MAYCTSYTLRLNQDPGQNPTWKHDPGHNSTWNCDHVIIQLGIMNWVIIQPWITTWCHNYAPGSKSNVESRPGVKLQGRIATPSLPIWGYSCRQKLQKLDMCLWNTDAPGDNKVKIWQKSLSPSFYPAPPPGAWDVSEVWGTLRWTYSPGLVTVSSPKL